VQLPEGLKFPKDVQQATALEQRAYESLAKTDAWQRAERKGDVAEMNRLMIGRGLDPAKHGGSAGAEPWKIATGDQATKLSTPSQGINTTPVIAAAPVIPTLPAPASHPT
jgi:hypothetical protein